MELPAHKDSIIKEEDEILDNQFLGNTEEEGDKLNSLRKKALGEKAFKIAILKYEQQLKLKSEDETEEKKEEIEKLIAFHIKQKADELRNADSKTENPFFKENTERLIEEMADIFIKEGILQQEEQEDIEFPEKVRVEPQVNSDATPEEKEKAKKERDEVIDSLGEENANRIRRELQAKEKIGLPPQLALAPLNNGLLWVGMLIPGANALISLATLYITLENLPKWPSVEVKTKPKISLPKKSNGKKKEQEPEKQEKPEEKPSTEQIQPKQDEFAEMVNTHCCCQKRFQCCCKSCQALFKKLTCLVKLKMMEETKKQQQTKINPPSKKNIETQTDTYKKSVIKMAFFESSKNCFVKLNNTEDFDEKHVKNGSYVEITEENEEQKTKIIKAITEQYGITEEEATNIVTTQMKNAEENKQKVLSGEQTNFEVTTIITEGVDEQEEKIEEEAKEQSETQVEHEEENKAEIISKSENEVESITASNDTHIIPDSTQEQQKNPEGQLQASVKSPEVSNQQQVSQKPDEPNEEPPANPDAEEDTNQQNLGSNPSNKKNTIPNQDHQQIKKNFSALNVKAENISEGSDQNPSKTGQINTVNNNNLQNNKSVAQRS